MNTSNITNYKPKDFMCSPAVCMDFVSIKNK